jgi:hypothetical protein
VVQLDDWVLCRIYKKTSHASPLAVPPLSDHELDEPYGGGGFDENPYAASSSAAMLVQGAYYPALQAATATPQRLPRIPSLSELFNDPSLAHLFEDAGGSVVPYMARLDQQHHHQHGGATTLLGHPVTSQLLLVNSIPGQTIPQMDLSASTPAAAGDVVAVGKRKMSSDTSTSPGAASAAAKKPNGSCFGATSFQISNGLQGSLGHHMLLHSNMRMN